jgi:hypothetical protein
MEGKHGAIASASPAFDPPEDPAAARRARLRTTLRPALIALARARLRQTKGGRWSALLGLLLLAAFGVIELILRADEGPGVAFGGLLETATRAITWAAGAPVALAAAHNRARADRDEGIEALAASRGAGPRSLAAVRTFAAMLQATIAVGAPLVVLALLAVVLTGSVPSALRHLGLALGLAGFSLVAGVTIGGVAAACERVGGARGRSLLLAVVLIPWVLTDLVGLRAWSIPGALNAALTFVVRASGLGGPGL